MTIRGHFDGRVIVPDEAVELPVNTPLDLDIRPADSAAVPQPPSVRQRVELPLIRGDGQHIINPTPEELDASLWGD